MGVVHVRDVCMRMLQAFMSVEMRVRFAGRITVAMDMLVVLVMNVGM
jgi:hypothetical protein